ncbi:MAG: hypothetical protein GKS07_10125 [Nitrosopumilus sp.]|nr:MAG: hypothetical protein GKS07_10125 [Nitrosopumilus sp.]
MKSRLLIIIGVVVAVTGIAMTMIHEIFPNSVLSDDLSFYDSCNLIRGENDTFYALEDCALEAFKPIKLSATFWSMELNQNMHEAIKIRDACIPVSKFDVNEIKGVLIIYFTEENKSKYIDDIEKIIKVPYVIKTTEKSPAGATNSLKNVGCYMQNLFEG